MQKKYFISALSAFVIWGFFTLAIRPLHNYPSLDILFYRVFFATILLLIINWVFRKNKLQQDYILFKSLGSKQKKITVLLTIMGGFLLTINWFLFMYAVNHISIKAASFAYLICPIITTVLAFFMVQEKLRKTQWFSVVLCAVSCGILAYGHVADLVFSLIIATSFALYLISQRKNNSFDKFVVLTVQLVIASVIILPFFPFYKAQTPTQPMFYGLMAIIVVVFTIIPLYLNLYALKGMKSGTVGILMYINPIINFILAIFYFNETVNTTQIMAYCLILLSIIIFNAHLLVNKKEVS